MSTANGKPRGWGSVTERDGGFIAIRSVTVRLKDGSTRRDRPERRFETHEEAERYLDSFVRRQPDQANSPNARRWLSKWGDRRVATLQRSGQGSYALNVGRYVRMHLEPYLDMPLADVRPSHFSELWNRLLFERELAPSTVRSIRSVARLAFREAVHDGLLVTSPIDASEMPTGSVASRRRREPDAFSESEMASLIMGLALLANEGAIFAEALLVCAATGLRRGELCGLTVGAWDQRGRTLAITQQVQGPNKAIVVSDLKTLQSRRTVSVDETTATRINALARGRTPGAWLFPNQRDASLPIQADSLLNYHHKVLERLGIRPLPVHALRHTQATLMLAYGAPVADVAARLGHSNPLTTMRQYAHDRKEARLADLWSAIVNGLPEPKDGHG